MALNELDTTLSTVMKPPSKGAGVWVNFSTSPTFPADATVKMSELEGWVSLGEISDAGYTESKSISKETKKGWHGTPLATVTTDESKKYKFVCVEPSRPSVGEMRYGHGNVTTGADGTISEIHDKFGVSTVVAVIFDEEESNGFRRLSVVKRADVTGYDDANHQSTDILSYGYELTVLDPGDGSDAVVTYRAKPVGA